MGDIDIKAVITNVKKLAPIVFPNRCPVCDKVVMPQRLICRECVGRLVLIREPMCMRCGKQLWQDEQFCYDCSRKHFIYERGFSLYNYNELTQKSIINFKYNGRAEYANFYGTEMAKRYSKILRRYDINAVLPVPIHKNRLGLRGYNQAALIGEKLCELTGMINLDGFIVRRKNTLPQKELDDVNRRKNMDKAFEVNSSFIIPSNIKNIVIVDDIYTTGVTIDACSRIVRDVIGCKVYFMVLAIGRGL